MEGPTTNPYAPPGRDAGTRPSLRPERVSSERALEIKRRVASLNQRSFLFGVPGIVLQTAGNFTQQPLVTLLGVVLLVIGLVNYAQMRGRHPALGLLGLLSCLGLVILTFLPKACLNCATKNSSRAKRCEHCGAPLGA